MTDYQFSPELDERLLGFVAQPGNFIADIGFVYALHAFPVVAIAEPFVVPIEDKKLIPVFTTEKGLETFLKTIDEPVTFVNKPFLEVVNELVSQEFDAIAFNIQPSGSDSPNTIMLPREHLVTFINRYTDVLNKLFSPENLAASFNERYYLLPAFARTKADGEIARIFATISKPDGESFVPAFTNIDSFSKWYNNPNFGQPFKENEGLILTWQLKDIQNPPSGVNELDDVLGIVIDPFDAVDYENSIILWDELANKTAE
ncbi:hypothetical protein Hs30E_07410 [Lactococcus hodotermopsidis]|uniref:SseB protein N-terminal domain-containing protein n=1 Tax=Pseudolactococcus hodotermopsidis TaxID=2709157 RepID=A0A6A0B9R5_9LACT|nr:SseB family protein [Lactococcus hodotermopsidis]GFH42190.1 hypothetical protein Hs30E_07410 [Lactococcus hodotermopsidis]